MLIGLALVIGAAVGLGLHYGLPRRQTRGAALGALTGAALAGVIWTGLTWLGLAEDNPWIWAASTLVPAVLTAVLLVLLSRAREAHDTRERARLGLG